MSTEPANDTPQQQTDWRSFVGALLTTMISAVTVLGAILLSLQGQAPNAQPIVRLPEKTGIPVDVIPTAPFVTFPPETLLPTSAGGTPFEASPTFPPDVTATPVLLYTIPAGETVTLPPPTSWPCAGGAPLSWRLYIVQPGETLFSLARRHGTTIELVIFYNCLQSVRLLAGQRLYLPALPTPIPAATTTASLTPSFTPVPSNPPPPPPSFTPKPAPTATETVVVTISSSPTPTSTPRSTPDALTQTPNATAIPTTTITPTATIDATVNPTISPSTTPTSESPTETAPPSPTATVPALPEPSPTLTLTPSPEPTSEPPPSETPSP